MKRRVFKTMWGAVGPDTAFPTFSEAVPAAARAGYDGVVFALIALQFDPSIGSLEELNELCIAHGLEQVFMVMTDGPDVDSHIASLRSGLETAARFDPVHVVAHTGRDSFDREQRDRCFREAVAMEADLPFHIGHETHRTRILFTPWTTQEVMHDHPELKLVADLSHWVVVAERMLPGEEAIISALASRSLHIDARVGHEQGPQVPDPRIDVWQGHVEAFETWWRTMLALNPGLVMVPEYGPPPYQMPESTDADPSATLWQICDWAAACLRKL